MALWIWRCWIYGSGAGLRCLEVRQDCRGSWRRAPASTTRWLWASPSSPVTRCKQSTGARRLLSHARSLLTRMKCKRTSRRCTATSMAWALWQTREAPKYVCLLCFGKAKGHCRLGDCHAAFVHGELLAAPHTMTLTLRQWLSGQAFLSELLGAWCLIYSEGSFVRQFQDTSKHVKQRRLFPSLFNHLQNPGCPGGILEILGSGGRGRNHTSSLSQAFQMHSPEGLPAFPGPEGLRACASRPLELASTSPKLVFTFACV